MARTYRTDCRTPSYKGESLRFFGSRTYRIHLDGTVTFDWDDERTRVKRAMSKARRRGDRMVIRAAVDELADCG